MLVYNEHVLLANSSMISQILHIFEKLWQILRRCSRPRY
jgi:hypothetical protein